MVPPCGEDHRPKPGSGMVLEAPTRGRKRPIMGSMRNDDGVKSPEEAFNHHPSAETAKRERGMYFSL